ncbi:unnamed protein product [Orchesella dallaii]|uniref:Ankyrin repeat protein n=1 Tax=Orchesella dallaii TaxID=48710 RepID=A0ABP1PSU8_9HEXA
MAEKKDTLRRSNNTTRSSRTSAYFIGFMGIFIKSYRAREILDIIETADLIKIKQVLEDASKATKITEICDKTRKSVLHVAVQYREYEIVEYLVKTHPFSEVLSEERFNDLIFLCLNNIGEKDDVEFDDSCKIIRFLLKIRPELIESKNSESQQTPLHIAATQVFTNGKQIEVIKMFLENNANVNAEDSQGKAPLHNIVRVDPLPLNLMEIVKLLIEHGADPYSADFKGLTFLHHAGFMSMTPTIFHELVEYLISIEKTKSFSMVASSGWTVLFYAVANIELLPETLKLLKAHGTDFNHSYNGMSALFQAISGGRSDALINQLIGLGADCRTVGMRGNALHHAVLFRHLSALKMLMNAGCDVNAQSLVGHTPLHILFLSKGTSADDDHEMVCQLIRHGANVSIKNKVGDLPIDIAKGLVERGRLGQRTVKLLETVSPTGSVQITQF